MVTATAAAAVGISLFLLFSYLNPSSNGYQMNANSIQHFPNVIKKSVNVQSPYTGHKVSPGNVIPISNQLGFNGMTINYTYSGINDTQGIIRLNNQTYYMTTLDGNLKSTAYNQNDTAIEFANVTFIFPSAAGIPGTTHPMFAVIVQFQDGKDETWYVQTQKDHPLTVLSMHNNPKAAITVTQADWLMLKNEDNQGKVKLLVSIN
jgi:hypothetical protein